MKKTSYTILPDNDFSETQIYVTLHTFDRYPKAYLKRWEQNPKTVSEIIKYNVNPFLKFAPKNGTLLLAGCRGGRDYKIFSEKGYTCIGVDMSYGLLTKAVRY